MRFLTYGFFHESLIPGPWIHVLKYFENIFDAVSTVAYTGEWI